MSGSRGGGGGGGRGSGPPGESQVVIGFLRNTGVDQKKLNTLGSGSREARTALCKTR